MKRRGKLVLGAVIVGMGACAGWCIGVPCLGAWASWGIMVDECPDGAPLLSASVNAYGLERGREGRLNVYANARYIDPRWGSEDSTQLRRFDAEVELDVGGERTPLEVDWDDSGPGYQSGGLTLPEDIPDGDHALIVTLDTPLGDEPVELRVKLPLYRPALAHVLSDRPLYQPGDTVRFRSLTLARGSFEPIDDRPGTWKVYDPDGELMLEERSAGGPWGVAQSSFPLSSEGPMGVWRVEWSSGDDSATTAVRVEPFTLPRFTVEVQSEEPWYGEGDRPALSGTVRYTSGAPVAEAGVELRAAQAGPWPPPQEWLEPQRLTTDAAGRFRWELPEVPVDLVGASALNVSVAATDPAGERQVSAARLLLSEDPVAVDAVTELGAAGELVSDFNNRVYVRVTTPDGRALSDEAVRVSNRWDSRDEGRALRSDADGVVAFQVDPGQPVNVEIPAQPVRPQRSADVAPLQATGGRAMLTGRTLSISERSQLDALARQLGDCAIMRLGTADARLVAVTRGGFITDVLGATDAAERCVARGLKGSPLGQADEIYETQWRLTRPGQAVTLGAAVLVASDGPATAMVRSAVAELGNEAQGCVQGLTSSGTAPEKLLWRSYADGRPLELRWVRDPNGLAGGSALPCIKRVMAGLDLRPEHDGAGWVQLNIGVPQPQRSQIPSPTVRPGYEFLVDVDGVGATTWRSQPGAVPDLRLRPSEVIVERGASFGVELLRGPGFSGELPDGLALTRGRDRAMYCPRTPKILKEADEDTFDEACPAPQDDNSVLFLAQDDGFHAVEYGGGRAVVYVPPAAELSVEISSDAPAYAPGATATLTVKTSSPAVVSLTGVDQSLGQLASLPEPGSLGALTVTAESDQPAFGIFDATALATGRVRGENAAMAAVQRVTVLGETSPLAPARAVDGAYDTDAEEALASTFYELLSDAQRAVRAWEKAAEEGEVLSNEQMAALWAEVLDLREADDKPVVDAWQRRMELWRLPEELLALTEPRLLVSDGTRVPEDIEPWANWVHNELER